jgi:hypothetical protein
MPLILAYHPAITVGSIIIKGNLDDYYTDDEILKACNVNSFTDLVPKLPLDTPIGLLYVWDESDPDNTGVYN